MGQDFAGLRGPTVGKLGPTACVADVFAPARDRYQAITGAQCQHQLGRARGQGNDAVKHGFNSNVSCPFNGHDESAVARSLSESPQRR